MIYKPEAVVDLDTGAIVQAQVQPGDEADHKNMAGRILEAQQNINRACEEKLDTLTVHAMARGVRDTHSIMKVNVMHGAFQKDQNLRNELLARLNRT